MELEGSGDRARVEAQLTTAISRGTGGACPDRLAAAMRAAVLPPGGLVRARLLLAVARACSAPDLAPAVALAAALELIHCASLVHDDLPCFDDAPLRRGRPTIHRQFDPATAVLVGDALIVLAFEELSLARAPTPDWHRATVALLARSASSAHGLIGGQGWEQEAQLELRCYHLLKTAALFEAATTGGALSAGADGQAWRLVGRLLGQAYQIADDLADVYGTAEDLGKEPGQDQRRPAANLVMEIGPPAALARLDAHIREAKQVVPRGCRDRDRLVTLIDEVAQRLVPSDIRDQAVAAAPASVLHQAAIGSDAP